MRRRLFSLVAAAGVVVGCGSQSSAPPPSSPESSRAASPPQAETWNVVPLEFAPAKFRPGGWSSEDVLWGLVGSRVTRLDLRTRTTDSIGATAWSLRAARGVVAWRVDSGTWMLRDGGDPVRLAGPEPDSQTGFDGPPDVLWSPDGRHAVLSWQGEWDARHELLDAADGSRRPLATALNGFFGNSAVLWLDATRILFQTVAKGPRGGEPQYRESGWRGDLAVFDLSSTSYTRVTDVPDLTYLRVAGLYKDRVLVTAWSPDGVRGHWLYDSRSWQRQAESLPLGRAFAANGGAVVVLLDATGDECDAVLISGNTRIELGRVSRDAEPVFAPGGRRGAMRAGKGVVMFASR